MTKTFHPDHLDVKAFAQAQGQLSGHETLLRFQRLSAEAQGLHPELRVDWQAHGSLHVGAEGRSEPWLHLQVSAKLPMQCQRCLQPVDVELIVDRPFRFVANEEQALEQDDECEEDLLVISRDFNLHELIEDELLMEVPIVPRHEPECPKPLPMFVEDEDFEQANQEKPNPFAALAQLRKKDGKAS